MNTQRTKRKLWTDRIGDSYLNSKGSLLTVIDKDHTSNRLKFVMSCSICSKDTELFPLGSITADVKSFKYNTASCGCTEQTSWSEVQNLVRVKRLAKDKGLEFLGWSGEYRKGGTFLRLYNPELSYCWSSTVLQYFVTTDHKCCPETKLLGNQKDRGILVERFVATGSYHKGSLFKKDEHKLDSDGRRSFWDFYCPMCAVDIFSDANVGSGWFKTTTSALSLGQLPCRCSPKHHYTEPQWLLRINKTIEDMGGSYIGLSEGFNKLCNRCYVDWKCHHGHTNKQRVGVLLNSPSCGTCGLIGGEFGFYPFRAEDIDNLYLTSLVNSVYDLVKIGRTFDIKVRNYEYSRHFDSVDVISSINKLHKEVFVEEKHLHGVMKEYQIIPDFKFGGSQRECFSPEILKHPLIIATFNL